MKHLKLSVAAGVILVLSACSNTPSESAAKKAIQETLGDCGYLSVSQFEKKNGIPDGDNQYRVEVAYSIEMTPIKQTVEDLGKILPAMEEARKTIEAWKPRQLEFDKLMSSYNDEKTGSFQSLKRLQEAQPQVYEKFNAEFMEAERARQIFYNAPNLRQTFLTRLGNECPKSVRVAMDFFDDSIPVENFAKNITRTYTGTIQMIKTDNGWEASH